MAVEMVCLIALENNKQNLAETTRNNKVQ